MNILGITLLSDDQKGRIVLLSTDQKDFIQ